MERATPRTFPDILDSKICGKSNGRRHNQCQENCIAPINEVWTMNFGKLVSMFALACALSACGGPVVTLKNPQNGALVSCKGGTFANGNTSQRVADDLITQCVDNYTRSGYEVVSSSS